MKARTACRSAPAAVRASTLRHASELAQQIEELAGALDDDLRVVAQLRGRLVREHRDAYGALEPVDRAKRVEVGGVVACDERLRQARVREQASDGCALAGGDRRQHLQHLAP